ncbi:hypothetical protein NL676_032978 [Syzygium grande]|nr:hypothetical protein NL676_032978 [Syzygium grande]
MRKRLRASRQHDGHKCSGRNPGQPANGRATPTGRAPGRRAATCSQRGRADDKASRVMSAVAGNEWRHKAWLDDGARRFRAGLVLASAPAERTGK